MILALIRRHLIADDPDPQLSRLDLLDQIAGTIGAATNGSIR